MPRRRIRGFRQAEGRLRQLCMPAGAAADPHLAPVAMDRPSATRTGVMLAILAAVVLLFSRPRRAR